MKKYQVALDGHCIGWAGTLEEIIDFLITYEHPWNKLELEEVSI